MLRKSAFIHRPMSARKNLQSRSGKLFHAVAICVEALEQRQLLSTADISPAADAYVRGGANASTNYGTTNPLQVKLTTSPQDDTRETYSRYDVTSVSTIGSATLRFYGDRADTAASSTTVQTFSVATTSWSEGTLTWNNKPTTGGTVLDSETISSTSPAWYTWDVSSYVSTQRASHTAVSFDMKASSTTSAKIEFNSREATSNTPVLRVDDGAPSALSSPSHTSSSINLSWTDNCINETGFKVDRATNSSFTTGLQTFTVNGATTYSDTGLSSATTYFYRVRAYNSNGSSSNTSTVSVTTTDVVPLAPSALTFDSATGTSITMHWTDNSNNETGFLLDRATTSSFVGATTLSPGDVTSYTDSGLSVGTTYYYRVRATNAIGSSANTSTLTASTVSLPMAPSGLIVDSGTPPTGSQIKIDWTDNSSNETGFKIDRATTSSFAGATTLTAAANATALTDTGLTAGTTYYYRVRATNSAGDSSNTSTLTTATITVPAAPSALTFDLATGSSIAMHWTDNSSNETGFKIERATTSTFAGATTLSPSGTSFTNTGLSLNTTYYYRVYAYNGAGSSSYSNTLTASTLDSVPTAPTDLVLTSSSATSIHLAWNDNSSNETEFDIYRFDGDGGEDFTQISLAANTTSYDDTSLDAYQIYYYTVVASNSGGQSYSNDAAARPQDTLTATTVDAHSINLEWGSIADALDYVIKREATGGSPVTVATIDAPTTTYTDTRLLGDTEYTYQIITDKNTTGQNFSAGATATTAGAPVGAPSGLAATSIGDHRVSLSWDAVSGATSYEIARTDADDNITYIPIDDPATLTFIDSGLTEQSTYQYQITVTTAAGTSDPSDSVSATTDTFKIYNSLNFGNVDLSSSGIPRIYVSTPIQNNSDGTVNLDLARQFARAAAGIDADGNYIHDPENLAIDQERLNSLTVDATDTTPGGGMDHMIDAIAAIREVWASYPDHPEFEDLKVGIYGDPPAPPPNSSETGLEQAYDDPADDAAALDAWDAASDSLAPLVEDMDFLAPSLYSLTTDQSSFGAQMSMYYREANRYDKPVYAFVWPEFMEFNHDVPVNSMIPGDYWQMIMDEARNESDGVILWGGVHQFDNNAPCAQITEGMPDQAVSPTPDVPTGLTVTSNGLHVTWDAVTDGARVRVEKSLDGGDHWSVVAITEADATSWDDPEYRTTGASDYHTPVTPEYRIQAFNPFSSSAFTDEAEPSATPTRDPFTTNKAYWADDVGGNSARQAFWVIPTVNVINPGSWVEYDSMDFADDADHLVVRARERNTEVPEDASFKVVLDATVNPSTHALSYDSSQVAGTVSLTPPDDWDGFNFYQWSSPVSVPAGNHKIFIITDTGAVDLDWIRFGGANDPSAAPRSLKADSTGGAVHLTWQNMSDDPTDEYTIERSNDEGLSWYVLTSGIAWSATPSYDDDNDTLGGSHSGPYTYRVSTTHGTGVATQTISDAGTMVSSEYAPGDTIQAREYDDSQGMNWINDPTGHPELNWTQIGTSSTNPNQVVGGWVRYRAVDFGSGEDDITFNLSTNEPTSAPHDAGDKITIFMDSTLNDLNGDGENIHEIGSFLPEWTGGPFSYENQTTQLVDPTTGSAPTGIHDLYVRFDVPAHQPRYSDGIGDLYNIQTIRLDHANPVPDNISVTAHGSNHIALAWDDTASGITGFTVEKRKVLVTPDPLPSEWYVNNPGETPNNIHLFIPWDTADTLSSSARSNDFTGLDADTLYEFRIVAQTSSGNHVAAVFQARTDS